MITEATFYGNSYEQASGAAISLFANHARLHLINTTAPGVIVTLPDSRRCKLGGPQFYIYNKGPDDIDIINFSSTFLLTLLAGEIALFVLSQNSGSGGKWHWSVNTANFVANPPLTILDYLIGRSNGSVAETKHVYQFNPQIRSWTQMADAPVAWKNATGFVIGSTRGYICCGDSPELTKVYEYDPDVWTLKGTFPGLGQSAGAASVISSKGYLFGGNGGATGGRATWEYENVGDAWTQKSDRVSNRGSQDFTAKTVASKAYLFNGNSTGGATFDNVTDEYVVDTYTAKMTRPAPVTDHNATFVVGATVYHCMGQLTPGGTTQRKDIQTYTAATDTWADKVDFPGTARAGGSGVTIGGRGYYQGGFVGSTATAQDECWEYDDVGDVWTEKANIPEATKAVLNQGLEINI